MTSFARLIFLIVFLPVIWLDYSHAQIAFTLSDVRGESRACEQSLSGNLQVAPICNVPKVEAAKILDQSALDIDAHLATTEIKREVLAMAESQVSLSLSLLQKLGIKEEDSSLSERLQSLQKSGIEFTRTTHAESPELLDKYLAASLRYYDLKRRAETYGLTELQKNKIRERVKLLEVRYPLIAQHNFTTLKDFSLPKLAQARAFTPETDDESMLLDNFLFNDTPEKMSALHFSGAPKSLAMSALQGFQAAPTDIKNQIRDQLKGDLQKSLASQLAALSRIDTLGDCDLLTLHSKVSQQAINSSAAPERVFRKLCECRKQSGPVPQEAVLGMSVASLGGLLLCITPTGVGQLLGCPTAFVAGWGATGASAVNFADSLSKYSDLNTQGNVMAALPRTSMNQKELALLRGKESEIAKDLGTQQVTSLIGFGVGHVGFKGLTEIYKKSKLSLSWRKLTASQQVRAEKLVSSLSPEEQTKMFVALDKLDVESREILLAHPEILLKEIKKGGRCEL